MLPLSVMRNSYLDMGCLMGNYDLYNLYYQEVRAFKSLTPQRQSEVIDIVKKSTTDYYFNMCVEYMIDFLDKPKALDLFKLYIKGTDKSYSHTERLIKVCNSIRKHDDTLVRSMAIDKDSCAELHKLILTYPDVTLDEEEQGLRALAKSKYPPGFLHKAKYQPRIEALKKLPSIMRLCCLETLTNQQYDSYNIFGRVTDEEEFKLLLFSSTLKHRDRAEAIWNKYKDLVGIGTRGSLKISGTCTRCGDFEIVLNSLVVKTQEGLKKARIGYYANGGCCPFCSGTLTQPSSVVEQEWKRQ